MYGMILTLINKNDFFLYCVLYKKTIYCILLTVLFLSYGFRAL